jgi:hypothetical protein
MSKTETRSEFINMQLARKKIFIISEFQENSVSRNWRITAADGKNYNNKTTIKCMSSEKTI